MLHWPPHSLPLIYHLNQRRYKLVPLIVLGLLLIVFRRRTRRYDDVTGVLGTNAFVSGYNLYDILSEEAGGKLTDLHALTVSTSLGHCLKVTLKRSLDLGCGRSSKVQTVAERSRVLTFRVSTSSTTREDSDEFLEVVRVGTDVIDSSST